MVSNVILLKYSNFRLPILIKLLTAKYGKRDNKGNHEDALRNESYGSLRKGRGGISVSGARAMRKEETNGLEMLKSDDNERKTVFFLFLESSY